MSYRIVLDSSCNILDKDDEHYATAPLHINIDGRDYPDAPGINMEEFDSALETAYELGRETGSACPSPDEWMSAFGDADEVYCITITHNLSGSFNSAAAAKGMYEEQFPDRHVYLIDSLATAGRMMMMYDYLEELIGRGITGEEAVRKVEEYRDNKTILMFTLQSMKRLASNGRVSALLIRAIGVLDIRLVGIASPIGTIDIKGKYRGASRVLRGTYEQMLKYGYNGGRVVISHNHNETDAMALKELILSRFGANTRVDIHSTTALCSYYAEKYGFITGFETG